MHYYAISCIKKSFAAIIQVLHKEKELKSKLKDSD